MMVQHLVTDSDIHVKFSNKTDSGLTIGMLLQIIQMVTDTDFTNDESSLSIAGGFGKIVLGKMTVLVIIMVLMKVT